MYAVSAEFLAALRTTHRWQTKVDVYQTGTATVIAKDIPMLSGTVQASVNNLVRWTFTGNFVDEGKTPPVDVYKTELDVQIGMVHATGLTEWVRMGVFRVNNMTRDLSDRTYTVEAGDRATRVIDLGMVGDFVTISPSRTYVDWVKYLIGPAFTFTDLTGSTAKPKGAQVIEGTNRLQVIGDIAAIVGGDVYATRAGGFEMAIGKTVALAASMNVDAGATGVLTADTQDTSRENVYNRVVLRVLDDKKKVTRQVTYQDNTTTSPTYVGGPFGIVAFYRDYTDTNEFNTASASASRLFKAKGQASRQITLEAVCNPALDPGDVINIIHPDGAQEKAVVQDISYSLDGGPMQIATANTTNGTLMP